MFVVLFCLIQPGLTLYSSNPVWNSPIIYDYFPTVVNRVEFGTGYTSIGLKRTYTRAVDTFGVELQSVDNVEIRLDFCKTAGDAFRLMSGDFVTAGSFIGVPGGTARIFLRESFPITGLDSVLVASIDVETEWLSAKGAMLKHAIGSQWAGEHPYEFIKMYGTHYLQKAHVGGRLLILLKFSKATIKEKEKLDTQLKAFAGLKTDSFDDLKERLYQLKERFVYKADMLVVGGDTPPPTPNIHEIIDYTNNFLSSVRRFSVVTKIEYHSLTEVASLLSIILPLQAKTDTLVTIAVGFYNILHQCKDIEVMKIKDTRYLSQEAWAEVQSIKDATTKLYYDLHGEFRTTPMSMLGTLAKKYSGKAPVMSERLYTLLRTGKVYRSKMPMYLKNAGPKLRFLSINSGAYPKLDQYAPLPVFIVNSDGSSRVSYEKGKYYYMGYHHQQDIYMCMGSGNWYVFLVHQDNMYQPKCQWRILNMSDPSKSAMEFGDRIVLVNKYWDDYIMGSNPNLEWLEDIEITQRWILRHQWIIEKTQF